MKIGIIFYDTLLQAAIPLTFHTISFFQVLKLSDYLLWPLISFVNSRAAKKAENAIGFLWVSKWKEMIKRKTENFHNRSSAHKGVVYWLIIFFLFLSIAIEQYAIGTRVQTFTLRVQQRYALIKCVVLFIITFRLLWIKPMDSMNWDSWTSFRFKFPMNEFYWMQSENRVKTANCIFANTHSHEKDFQSSISVNCHQA